ncbi:1-acyl-sn-glycerol-3-phosphate acyltransferase [Mycobacterium sp. IDR2000157661]|nr:1-acyl-sn-glycerol-3-phosphate acyltransferase [Mycobacterium sp. IDR2000157661]
MSAISAGAVEFVRRYHRLDIDAAVRSLPEPVLFVANHGFGGVVDLNVFAVRATLAELNLDRPVTVLTHQLAWTLRVGRLLEPLGARPASRDSAVEAFDAGHHVLVFPGGDKDAGKTFEDRNRVIFDGRSGFAKLAIDRQVPIVPVVTAGAGESLLVLSSGERLARALRLDKLFRVKALPVSVSLPWGLNVGAVGLLPYIPLPTKLVTRVLPPMTPGRGESAEAFGSRVEADMQSALTDLTEGRWPLLG